MALNIQASLNDGGISGLTEGMSVRQEGPVLYVISRNSVASARFVCLAFVLVVVTNESLEGGLRNILMIWVLPVGTCHALYIDYMVVITKWRCFF